MRADTMFVAANLTLKGGQGGNKVQKNAAISMQMMDWPDAVNHPEWQREHKILHGPDGLMTTFSSFKFKVARKKSERGDGPLFRTQKQVRDDD